MPVILLFFVTLLLAQIAHNLLWHINVEETLTLATANPKSLFTVVEIKDPHGQRVRGTPMQILVAAGDRDTRRMEAEEKNYGLAERLRTCFRNPEDYNKQIAKWYGKGSEEATKQTMAPYKKAIETLCQEITESTDIFHGYMAHPPFELLLDLPIAKKFREALRPNPDHVVKSGFLFDMQIFVDFYEIYDANHTNFGGWLSVKDTLFNAIVYPALQARTQRVDHEIFKMGFENAIKGQVPAPTNFSKGIPADFVGFGISHYFDGDGNQLSVVPSDHAMSTEMPLAMRMAFSKIVSNKNIRLREANQPQNHKSKQCVMM